MPTFNFKTILMHNDLFIFNFGTFGLNFVLTPVTRWRLQTGLTESARWLWTFMSSRQTCCSWVSFHAVFRCVAMRTRPLCLQRVKRCGVRLTYCSLVLNWSASRWTSETFQSSCVCDFQAKFTITKSEDELSGNVTYIIECEGSGATNPHL